MEKTLRRSPWAEAAWCTAAVLGAAVLYLGLLALLGESLTEHSAYDSYTLAALQWRKGRIALDQDYPWLELAIYQGRYYVSFPPFPTLPMYLLTFLFGENTPSRVVSFALFLGVVVLAFSMLRRAGVKSPAAALFALALPCGCNMMEYGLFGGVWNMAQVMGFFLTLLAFYGLQRGTRFSMGLGLTAIACAVGCRPFQAVYVPLLLWLCWKKLREQAAPRAALGRLAVLCLLPGLIALGYGVYNTVRFGAVFEFGHNYLPEFTRSQEGQFSLSYIPNNLRNVLRLPEFKAGELPFPWAGGFAFWLTNMIYLPFTALWICRAVRRKWSVAWSLTLAAVTVHFLLLLMHKSFGGVQFGTRYLCDLIPALFAALVTAREEEPWPRWAGWSLGGLAVCAVAVNTWGAYAFQMSLKG